MISVGGREKVVFLHRLPHMKLSSKTLTSINLVLFSLVVILAIPENFVSSLSEIIQNLAMVFDMIIFPGLFIYFKYRQKWLKEDVDVP